MSITGFESSLRGLSLTSESMRTLEEMTDIRRPSLTASAALPSFARWLSKPVHLTLEERKYGTQRKEGQERQHDEDEDASHEHEGERDPIGLQAARLVAPLPAYHRSGE